MYVDKNLLVDLTFLIFFFISMEVDMDFSTLNTDWLLQTHPLTARKEIEKEVVRIAKETMSPMVTKTISNIAFHSVSLSISL